MELVQSECSESVAVAVVANGEKRIRDEVNEPGGAVQTEKKQKIDDGEQSSEDNETDDPLKLDDLNNHCLRHIFEFLSIHDLIKVAQSAGQLGFASAEAFSRRYRQLRFEVTVASDAKYPWSLFGSTHMNGAEAMAALEHFGARMLTLAANFSAHQLVEPAQRQAIDAAILNKCSNSLQTFEIHFCTESHFEMIEKPFAKVEKLVVNGCTLGVKFAKLNKWFPNLVDLKLSGVKSLQPIEIETHFEHLTTLHIANDEDAIIPEHMIRKMLQLNRQLKSLKLCCDYGAEALVTIKDSLVVLESLELWIPKDCFASYNSEQKISLSALKTFSLRATRETADVMRMPFVLANVSELHLHGFNQYHPLISELIASGDQLKTIKMIPLGTQQWHSLNDYEAFKRALLTRHQLNQLELSVDGFVGDDLVRFIGQCKHVNELRLMTTYNSVLKSLSLSKDDWVMSDSNVKMHLTDPRTDNVYGKLYLIRYVWHMVIKRNK